MTPQEIELIKIAQDYCRRRKAKEAPVFCPMVPIDLLKQPLAITECCRLCFKWMRLRYVHGSHPCVELSESEIRKRFWQKPERYNLNVDQIH